VKIPEGVELFRIYKGEEYRAEAKGGRFLLKNDGQLYASLNKLSRAVGPTSENAWINWFFVDSEGQRRPVADLRDPATIVERKKGGEDVARAFQASSGDDHVTWRDDVERALQQLGGKASLDLIYRTVEQIRKAGRRSVPPSLDATIRRTLEDHSSDSANYRGGLDIFCMSEGKGAGMWALRSQRQGITK
jgi:hypothetical protein